MSSSEGAEEAKKMFDFRSFVKLRDYYEKLRGQSDKSL